MKPKLFDSYEQEQQYNAKKKPVRNNIIALVIIIPIIGLALWLKFIRNKDKFVKFFYAIKSGEIFDIGFLILLGVAAVITAMICLIFRKKEHSNAKLISGAITAAAGITMIGMLIIMCVNAV